MIYTDEGYLQKHCVEGVQGRGQSYHFREGGYKSSLLDEEFTNEIGSQIMKVEVRHSMPESRAGLSGKLLGALLFEFPYICLIECRKHF